VPGQRYGGDVLGGHDPSDHGAGDQILKLGAHALLTSGSVWL